jgi:hypothetical protein
MDSSATKRNLRVRSSAEAFNVLRTCGTSKISHAELLRYAVKSDLEPHPRVVREVHQALLEANAAQPKPPQTTLARISGIFSRSALQPSPIDDVVRRFEQAFVRPD